MLLGLIEGDTMTTCFRNVAVFVLLFTVQLAAQNTYTSEQAKNHIGENATVCGVVASTHFAASSRGEPTFLNLDKRYPNQIFTILIWGSYRAKFGAPEREYANKSICVTGAIEEYRGAAEIIAHDPSQIKMQGAGQR
jgi:hypothetical protein